VVSALGIGLFQVVGSFGAAQNQPARKGVDALALLLVLAGPIALAWRDRRPLPAVVVAMVAADVYIGLGYAYGPIFLSVAVALYTAAVAGRRHPAWLLAAAGYAGYLIAVVVDPRAENGHGAADTVLFAVWPALVLAVAEVVRARRSQAAAAESAAREAQQRRAGEQRLRLAQELHDVLGPQHLPHQRAGRRGPPPDRTGARAHRPCPG